MMSQEDFKILFFLFSVVQLVPEYETGFLLDPEPPKAPPTAPPAPSPSPTPAYVPIVPTIAPEPSLPG